MRIFINSFYFWQKLKHMKSLNKVRLIVLTTIVFCLAFLNIYFSEIPNFSPIAATALFAGAFIKNRKLAFVIPISAIIISDIFIGFHATIWAVYLSFFLVVLLGMNMKKINLGNVLGFSILGSLLFFLVTNFAVWAQGSFYPSSFSGLMECYYMGIPFFKNTIIGDVCFNAILFASFSFAEARIPSLKFSSSN